ncbi:unnamed protein product [Prunus armeniaca]
MKIFKGNWERGNWPTNRAVKSDKRQGKSLSDSCVLNTGIRKYLMPTGNWETGQPHMQSYRAGGWGSYGRSTNYVLSTGTQKYLKANGSGETG